ncbi:PEP-CTERM sorting domain-containing protein [Kiritimatiellaeota bacterium B1221]|nr:PEP-CTERM sorting domain-containing protein [Kiritimatiellaeota bacterium B1221]
MNKFLFPFALLITFGPWLSAGIILIDFGGGTAAGSPRYNNVTFGSYADDITPVVSDFVDTDNVSTGITLHSTNWFHGTNSAGTTSGAAPYASSATGNTLFDANTNWSASADNEVVLVFGGLDLSKSYDFTMYASRTGAGDNRSTLYSFAGGNSGSSVLDPAGNITETTTVSSLTPNGFGEITLTMTPDAANTNSYKFIYLGVMEIKVIPEPTTITLVLGALGVMILFRRRR